MYRHVAMLIVIGVIRALLLLPSYIMAAFEIYMHRCLQLAKLGACYVAPNPMVGAVLVYDDKIIGEGYHQQYGGTHAEVNCIVQVIQNDQIDKLSRSTLYVSLEPCSHFGKTPPCADLIIQHKIPKVVTGTRDPFKQVDGKGIEKLQSAGIEVIVGVLEDECHQLNKCFFTFHTKHRPHIILKWAQTADGKIARLSTDRLLISNEVTNRLVHKWRSEEAAILVGTNTAIKDDPSLNARLWSGKHPKRLILDMELKIPRSHKIFKDDQETIIFNTVQHGEERNIFYYQLDNDANVVYQIINACYQMKIQSILVEGGAKLIQSFINAGIWDEARIITNESLVIGKGLSAPILTYAKITSQENILTDKITYLTQK
jgi:diaminohydroxyphosphoribosylaminopyrimidine deaminase/5-amino-6-(5-phosphoribosylamino)uracil reductase